MCSFVSNDHSDTEEIRGNGGPGDTTLMLLGDDVGVNFLQLVEGVHLGHHIGEFLGIGTHVGNVFEQLVDGALKRIGFSRSNGIRHGSSFRRGLIMYRVIPAIISYRPEESF